MASSAKKKRKPQQRQAATQQRGASRGVPQQRPQSDPTPGEGTAAKTGSGRSTQGRSTQGRSTQGRSTQGRSTQGQARPGGSGGSRRKPRRTRPHPQQLPGASAPGRGSAGAQQLDLDVPALVRGGSAGFTILLLGSTAQPIAAHASPVLGGLWLTLVGLVGFGVAGWRIGTARRLALQGAAAALVAYGLTLPLVVYVQHRLNGWQTAVTFAFAVVVGGGVGLVRGKALRRS